MLILSGKAGGGCGDYLEMVLLIGVCLWRGLHIAQPTEGAQCWKDAAQRASKLIPTSRDVCL